jgi:hypothetical protein
MAINQLDFQILVERLEKIEKTNRRLKCLLLAVCGTVLSLFMAGHFERKVEAAEGPGQVLEAQELRIKDSHGNLRAQIRAGEDSVGFVLYGNNNQEQIAIAAGPQANGLQIHAPNDKTSIGLIGSNDGPSVGFYDSSRTVRAFLALENNNPSLSLYDRAGNARTSLSLSGDGPSLTLNDVDGSRRASLGLTSGVRQTD